MTSVRETQGLGSSRPLLKPSRSCKRPRLGGRRLGMSDQRKGDLRAPLSAARTTRQPESLAPVGGNCHLIGQCAAEVQADWSLAVVSIFLPGAEQPHICLPLSFGILSLTLPFAHCSVECRGQRPCTLPRWNVGVCGHIRNESWSVFGGVASAYIAWASMALPKPS
jgi:hypothetical protein